MIAIITGASSGIGEEFAKQIDKFSYDEIWLIARRKEKLEKIKENLTTRAKILALDLLDDKSFEIFQKTLEKEKPEIDILVNSAGFGVNNFFKDTCLRENADMIRLNDLALTKITYLALDYMKENSAIINIASVAAFLPQPKFAIYAASKSYVLSFSKALNRELRDKKINVCTLCPNPVETEFFKNFDRKEEKSIKSLGLENLSKMVEKTLRFCKKRDLITSHPLARLILIAGKIFPHSFIMRIEKKIKMY